MSDEEESFVCKGIAWVSEGSVLTARHISHILLSNKTVLSDGCPGN